MIKKANESNKTGLSERSKPKFPTTPRKTRYNSTANNAMSNSEMLFPNIGTPIPAGISEKRRATTTHHSPTPCVRERDLVIVESRNIIFRAVAIGLSEWHRTLGLQFLRIRAEIRGHDGAM